MDFKELKIKSEAELKSLLEDFRGQAHDLKMNVRMSREKKTHKLKELRQDIARIMTILNK